MSGFCFFMFVSLVSLLFFLLDLVVDFHKALVCGLVDFFGEISFTGNVFDQ